MDTPLRAFFLDEFGIPSRRLVRKPHITVYHCRRPMKGLRAATEQVAVVLPAGDARFMIMSPGGEIPRPDMNPADLVVGIRIHRQSAAMLAIYVLRGRLFRYEDEHILGGRSPSTMRTSAFGARAFQPHMSILKADSGIDRDLTAVGDRFRNAMGSLTFDTFEVDVDVKDT